MKVYVINLKRRTDRKDSIVSQFKNLDITNYEFIEAVDGQKQDLSKFANKRLQLKYGILSNAEMAVALSHKIAYNKIIASGERGIIVEDDVIINQQFKNIIDLNIPPDPELFLFGYFTSLILNDHTKVQTYFSDLQVEVPTERGEMSRCYFKNKHIDIQGIKFYKVDEESYNNNFLHGAHAYSPSVQFCKTLLAIQKKIIFTADDLWNYLPKFGIDNVEYYAMLNPCAYQNVNIQSEVADSRQIQNTAESFINRVSNKKFGE